MSAQKKFSDYRDLCLISFFALGNYFALFGIPSANRAVIAHIKGDEINARTEALRARRWALWGLIPSTIINVALIYYVCVFTWRIMQHMMKTMHY